MTEYHPEEHWSHFVIGEDGAVPVTSMRFRYPAGSRRQAEIRALKAAGLLDEGDRTRLRVARYRLPVRPRDPVEILETFAPVPTPYVNEKRQGGSRWSALKARIGDLEIEEAMERKETKAPLPRAPERSEQFAVVVMRADGSFPSNLKGFQLICASKEEAEALLVEKARRTKLPMRDRLRVVRFDTSPHPKRRDRPMVIEVYPSPVAGKSLHEVEFVKSQLRQDQWKASRARADASMVRS